MSSSRSCIVREFPVPDREYRAAPPSRWDAEATSRPAPRPAPRRASRRRRPRLLPLALTGLALFAGGFLLGRAAAAESALPAEPRPSAQSAGLPAGTDAVLLPEEPQPAVRVFGVPGAILSEEGKTGGGAPSSADGTAWNLRLVNGDHLLPEDFSPPELTQLANGHRIDSRVYPELQAMMDAARAAGYQPLICSSFRTWDKQEELFERKVASCLASASSRAEAEAQAALWVARPGASEHQMGLAVDIVDKEYQLLDQAQESRPVQQWLMAHCAEYGFILRYPTDKSALTGVGYEPWHYRYVGKDAAQAITSAGLCLEEYLA